MAKKTVARKKSATKKTPKKTASGNGRPKKKKAGGLKQLRIAGTFTPAPKAVQTKVDDYVVTLRLRQSKQQREDVLRVEVIELMRKNKLERVDLTNEKYLLLEDKGVRLSIKSRETEKVR